jgi:hypothetical protein
MSLPRAEQSRILKTILNGFRESFPSAVKSNTGSAVNEAGCECEGGATLYVFTLCRSLHPSLYPAALFKRVKERFKERGTTFDRSYGRDDWLVR